MINKFQIYEDEQFIQDYKDYKKPFLKWVRSRLDWCLNKEKIPNHMRNDDEQSLIQFYSNKYKTFVYIQDNEHLDNIGNKGTEKPTKELFISIKKIFKKYIDTSELNYNLFTLWTLGTHFHNQFETYPLLLLNARKGSGKTRTLKLISSLSEGGDGSISTSVTETYLFRHPSGAVFFDEMESVSSKQKTALRETINSVYKKGNKIVRYTEKKLDGENKYVEECFYPFYPLGLANINGFGDVLADRSLQLVIQRSSKSQTKLIEDFSTNKDILKLKEKLLNLNIEIPEGIFTEWNNFVEDKKFNEKLKKLFDIISNTELSARPLELFFPLFLVAERFGVLKELIISSKEYMDQQEGEYVDSIDDLLQDFMDKQTYSGFNPLSRLLGDFRNSLENPDESVNSKWLGNALKRLGLVRRKKMLNGRVQIELNKNSTNTTISTNTTNNTYTTNDNQGELGELGELDRVNSLEIKPQEFA